MDLRHLRYFVAVAEERGFRRASRVLIVAQPALSRALGQLEQELGVQLLLRTPRGVELSDAGREFLPHAQSILARAEEARAAMLERRQRTGLRIGVIAGMLGAGELTAPIFQDHREAHPDLSVAFEELSFCDQLGPLLSGHLDAALVRGPLVHPGVDVVPIAEERRALMVGAGHELAGEDEVDAADVLGERMLPLGSPDAWSGFWQLDDLRGHSNVFEGCPPATSIPDMQLMVADGRMAITVPDSMGRLAPNALVRCVTLRDAPTSTIGVARRRGDERPDVEAFVEQAVRTTEERIELLSAGALPAG